MTERSEVIGSSVLVADRYRLLGSLGYGGMGRVWLARDEILDRDVAIKEVVLPFGLPDGEREELVQRTLREARTAARLSHPNVVRIYDVVRTDGQPWIVMEYVPSRSLLSVIRSEGPLSPQRVARIGLAVLAALDASHRAGVLHRDVKPSNVLIANDGRVVLSDFGLATFEEGDHAVTRPGLILGSPHYIAPERARDGVSTAKSDLWSLGATLYAAVEGRSPFARATTLATLTALATERPDPTKQAGAMKPVLEGLLRKNPRTRFGVAEAEKMLRRVVAGEGNGRANGSRKQRGAPPESRSEPVIDHGGRTARGRPATESPLGPIAPAIGIAGPIPGPRVPPAIGTAHVPPAPAANGANGGRAASNATAAIGMASVTLPGGIPWVVPPTTATGTASVPVVAPPVEPAPVGPTPAAEVADHRETVTTATPVDIARPARPVSAPPKPTPATAGTPATVETVIPITGRRRGPDPVLPFPVVPAPSATDADSPSGTSGLPGESVPADAVTGSLRPRGSHRSGPLRWVAAAVALPAVGALVMSSGGSVNPQAASAQPRPAANTLKAPGPVEIRADAAPAIGQQQLPAGWSWYQYPTGFRVAAPSAWPLVWEEQIEAYFCEPHGARMLVFSPMDLEGREPADALVHEESEDPLPGYQRLRVTPVSYRGGAADIEYLYNDPMRGQMHGINRSFVVDGKGYLIEWRTKPADWDRNLPVFTMIANSFDAPRERAVHVD